MHNVGKCFLESTIKNYPTTPSNKLSFTMAQIHEIYMEERMKDELQRLDKFADY